MAKKGLFFDLLLFQARGRRERDERQTGPRVATLSLDGDIAVVPLYAAYTVHCYLANRAPVHSSMMVKRVMRHFNIALGRDRENKGQKQQGAEKRVALGL